MSFKYSVIGDNAPENREWLEKIGYKKHFLDSEVDPLLHTWVGSEPINTPGYSSLPIDSVWNPDHPDYSGDMIDCRNNPKLFRAVSAMRDDSDYMQWFKTDFENKLIPDVKEMYLCKSREFCGITVKYKEEDFVIGSAGFHKATLEELINHFKHV